MSTQNIHQPHAHIIIHVVKHEQPRYAEIHEVAAAQPRGHLVAPYKMFWGERFAVH